MKKLSFLLKKIDSLEIHGRADPEIQGINYNSKEVCSGDLFVALEGMHTDGHLYIDEALKKGAIAVILSKDLHNYEPGIVYIRVNNTRRVLSQVSSWFFDYPSEKLTVIGITGTDGKSTTVWLTQQLLEAMGMECGFSSTVNFKTGQDVEKNSLRQSTPEAPEMQRLLREMVDNGKQYAVIEATSHGLSEKTNRLSDVQFNYAILTNISHEHLEFHGTFEQYRSDKANLFRKLTKIGNYGVVNMDDPNYRYFISRTESPVYTYSIKSSKADLYALDFKEDIRGTSFTLFYSGTQEKARLNIPGPYNVENLLAVSLLTLKLLNTDLETIIPFFPCLRGPKGRLELIDQGQPFQVIVDYAHTPESFEKTFTLIKQHTKGSIISVFGSAGERDTEKRFMQGKVASGFSEIIVLADEDPRAENSLAILEEIAAGCSVMVKEKNLFIEPDRNMAIRLALSKAEPDDTVLLLGKGHEQSIIYSSGSIPWDEADTARNILSDMGFSR